MTNPIADIWLNATILIENDWTDKGTGFLVRPDAPVGDQRTFLVTNKHVLGKDPGRRDDADHVLLHVNVAGPDNFRTRHKVEMPLDLAKGSKCWREHPDRDVDVLAFEVTQLVADKPEIVATPVSDSLFVDPRIMERYEITAGDGIITIGYPDVGIRHHKSNLPLLRRGIIASHIGEPLEDEIQDEPDSPSRQRVLRGFLIDGAIVEGSSGSPVVLEPTPARFHQGGVGLGIPAPVLLGIVTYTTYTSVRVQKFEGHSLAGLALALDAETVRETIRLFYH